MPSKIPFAALLVIASACNGPDDSPWQRADLPVESKPSLAATPASLHLSLLQGTATYDVISISNPSDAAVTLESATLRVGGEFKLYPMSSLPLVLEPHGSPWLIYVGLGVADTHPTGELTDTLEIAPGDGAASLQISLSGTVSAPPP